jgi:hypothetical protein
MTRRAFRTKYYYQRVGKGAATGSIRTSPKKVQGYADLMDALQYGCFEIDKGLERLASVAITELQGAQMWAVKAATWKD